MTKLQQPKYVFMGGGLRLWKEATLHVGCEAVTRSLNVFEGLKGYWKPDGPFGIVQLRQHYERLCRSARLLHIPFDAAFEYYRDAILELAGELLEPDRDMWFRTTLYAIEGQWGEGTVADLVITAYHQNQKVPDPINLGISTWRRSPDVSLPARIKAGSNYQVARLARIEGRARGCQDMVLLNNSGRVAEATGSCIVMVTRWGRLYSTCQRRRSREYYLRYRRSSRAVHEHPLHPAPDRSHRAPGGGRNCHLRNSCRTRAR